MGEEVHGVILEEGASSPCHKIYLFRLMMKDHHAELPEKKDKEMTAVVAEDELVRATILLPEVIDDVVKRRGELGDPALLIRCVVEEKIVAPRQDEPVDRARMTDRAKSGRKGLRTHVLMYSRTE